MEVNAVLDAVKDARTKLSTAYDFYCANLPVSDLERFETAQKLYEAAREIYRDSLVEAVRVLSAELRDQERGLFYARQFEQLRREAGI